MKEIRYPSKFLHMDFVKYLQIDGAIDYKTKADAEKVLADLNDLASELSLPPLDIKVAYIPFGEECFYLAYNTKGATPSSLVAIDKVLEARKEK